MPFQCFPFSANTDFLRKTKRGLGNIAETYTSNNAGIAPNSTLNKFALILLDLLFSFTDDGIFCPAPPGRCEGPIRNPSPDRSGGGSLIRDIERWLAEKKSHPIGLAEEASSLGYFSLNDARSFPREGEAFCLHRREYRIRHRVRRL